MPTLESELELRLRAEDWADDPLLAIIGAAPLPSLTAGPRSADLARWLRGVAASSVRVVPLACQAGLWLLAGDLDASHEISQSDPSPEGSFWHGVMHRREGDFGNAKYWFRRVGRHQILDRLAMTDYGDPSDFVDRCQRANHDATANRDSTATLESLQWLEWQYLFDHCLGGAD